MTALARLRHRVSGTADPFRPEPAMEAIYRDLFVRELAKLGEDDAFFPVGGAANYSLLYLILRVGVELQPRSVLDVGAGQSTLLWSLLQRHGLVRDVLTLESDADWGERIGARVSHPVLVTPLRPQRIEGREVMTYDWAAASDGRRFDAIVCDGPIGTPRHSRSGVLTMLDGLGEDFLLILDDAERRGEQDTIARVHARLQAMVRDYGVGVLRAAKSQAAFAGGRFRPATYL